MQLENSKIFDDGEKYLTLLELSRAQKYGLEYLLDAASRGQLKAFKIGDDWLTTAKWFDDYNFLIKKEIAGEVARFRQTDEKSQWADFFTKENRRLAFRPQIFLIIIIFSLFSFSLSWLAFSPRGNKMALAASNLVNKKYVAANYFLNSVHGVYGYGSGYLAYLFNSSLMSVGLLYDATLEAAKGLDQIALGIDNKTRSYKISDEIITEGIHELAEIARHKYRAVAGTEEIRRQIYFSEWQKSSESGN